MPRTAADLVDLLTLETIEPDLFRGPHPETQLQRAFGGQVLAQAVMAAYGTVPEERRLHSMHAYFLRPGRVDLPMLFDVEKLRDGRSFSSRRIMARQGGQSIFQMSASFHVPEPGLDHHDPQPAGVPSPEECPRMDDVLRERYGERLPLWREWEALDVRLAGESGPRGSMTAHSHGAHMRVWVRTNGPMPDGVAINDAVLAYMSDMTILGVSTVPHPVAFLTPQVQAASIDHAMWFHRSFRTDQWLLYDQVSPSASSSLGFSSGRLFQDGLLVASCAQEGLIRVVS